MSFMTTNDKLASCPFCGVQPITKEWNVGGFDQIKIICDGDLCHVHPSIFGNKEAMVEAWNTRAAQSSAEDIIKELAEALNKIARVGDKLTISNAYDSADIMDNIAESALRKAQQYLGEG